MPEDLALAVDARLGVFEAPGVPPVPDGERLLPNIEGLIERARAADATVVHVRHAHGPGHPLEGGTDGWRSHPRVAPPDGGLVAEIGEELESRGIKCMVVAGMQTEYRVGTTCRRAFGLGYGVTLAADAHGTWNDATLSAGRIVAHHNEVMGNGFAEVVPPGEILFKEPVQA